MTDERFRLLVAHAPVCIHEIDLDGRLTAMNPAGLAMLGIDDESAICGMPYLDAVGDLDRTRVADLLDQALHHGAAHFEFLSAGDQPRHFASNFIPMRDESGEVQRLMGVTRDVTAQRDAEAALRQLNEDLEAQVAARTAELETANLRLRQRNQELDEFAHAVSHDLKSPLTTITGLASILENLETHPDRHSRLSSITGAAQRMGRMIDEILEVARAGQATGALQDGVELDRVLDQVCEDLGRAISAEHAQVTRGALPTLRCSPTEQHRLLLNLVGNSLKFRGDGPARVHVSADPVGSGWAVHVADQGVGIPAAQQENIFQVFARVPETQDLPGSGVGLAICKKLVEARGGSLSVASAPGEGSRFTYTVVGRGAAAFGRPPQVVAPTRP